MAIKHCGDSFDFPSEFGFSGSAAGRADPRAQTPAKSPEFGDGLKKGGPVNRAIGGSPIGPAHQSKEPTISMPASTALKTAGNLVRVGAIQGARAAAAAHPPPMAAPMGPPPPPPALGALSGTGAPGPAPGMGPPAVMAKGGHMKAKTRPGMGKK